MKKLFLIPKRKGIPSGDIDAKTSSYYDEWKSRIAMISNELIY